MGLLHETTGLLSPAEPADYHQISLLELTRRIALPPCARRILAEGVSGFQRVLCFRLAVHLKRNGIPYDIALVVLKTWARKNRPADGRRIITEPEIEYQARCAFANSYRSFGCENEAMAAYCHKDCPLHQYTVGKASANEGPCGGASTDE